jgi:REP element-mobilizing transposase RayT
LGGDLAKGDIKDKCHGGTGFQPVGLFQITRRNLPHWQQPGRVYFITWRAKNGVILAENERSITHEAVRFWDMIKWIVYAAVILPDHVHVLSQPLSEEKGGFFELAEIIHSVKSFSAQKISRHRGVKGTIWQDERYDRIVRDEAEFLEKWQYIRNNPVKVGLSQTPEEYPWL